MFLIRLLESAIDFIAEAVLEIFSPNHDDYPTVGEQPFGDPLDQNRHSRNV